MLRDQSRRAGAVLVAAALLLQPSCVLVAAGAVGAAAYGVLSYHENEVWMDFHAEAPQVWEAALASLKEHGYTPAADARLGSADGTIRAGNATVRIERHPQGVTRAKASVGTFDTAENRRLGALILEDTKRRLAP